MVVAGAQGPTGATGIGYSNLTSTTTTAIADPGKILPILVKAVQELAIENDNLKMRVAALEALNSSS